MEQRGLYAAISKSIVTVSGAIPGRCCSNKRKIRLYTASDLCLVAAYTKRNSTILIDQCVYRVQLITKWGNSKCMVTKQIGAAVQYIQILLRRKHVKPVLVIFLENEGFFPRCHAEFID